MISRMIDSSKKKKWFFRSRPGAANPSSHSHPLREPRKLKFFGTCSENTSSHHHPCQQFRNRKNMSTHIRMTVQTESLESVLVARWAIGCETGRSGVIGQRGGVRDKPRFCRVRRRNTVGTFGWQRCVSVQRLLGHSALPGCPVLPFDRMTHSTLQWLPRGMALQTSAREICGRCS